MTCFTESFKFLGQAMGSLARYLIAKMVAFLVVMRHRHGVLGTILVIIWAFVIGFDCIFGYLLDGYIHGRITLSSDSGASVYYIILTIVDILFTFSYQLEREQSAGWDASRIRRQWLTALTTIILIETVAAYFTATFTILPGAIPSSIGIAHAIFNVSSSVADFADTIHERWQIRYGNGLPRFMTDL